MSENESRYKTLIDFSRILSLFEEDGAREISIAEIARALQMLPSKASRMMKTLEAEGFFNRNPISRKYGIGARLLHAGLLFAHNHPLRSVILPHLEQISNDSKSLTSWAVFERDHVFIVDRMPYMRAAPVHLLGSNVPLHSSSIGKLFLAHIEEKNRARIIKNLELVEFTPATLSDLNELDQELKKIKKQGYAVDKGETHQYLEGIAAPIFDAQNQIVAAIAISSRNPRLKLVTNQKTIKYLIDKTTFISRQLGCPK